MKTAAIALAILMVVPSVTWAADYTSEGRVDLTTAGADVPGFSAQEVAIIGAGAGIFTTLAFFDYPLGKFPTMAAGAAGVLAFGAYRKSLWDGSSYDTDQGGVMHMAVESGTAWDLVN